MLSGLNLSCEKFNWCGNIRCAYLSSVAKARRETYCLGRWIRCGIRTDGSGRSKSNDRSYDAAGVNDDWGAPSVRAEKRVRRRAKRSRETAFLPTRHHDVMRRASQRELDNWSSVVDVGFTFPSVSPSHMLSCSSSSDKRTTQRSVGPFGNPR